MLQTEVSSPSQKTGTFVSHGSLSTMFDSPIWPFTAFASQNTDNLFTASTTNVPFEATHHLVHPASASAPIVPDFKRGVSSAQKRLSKRSRLSNRTGIDCATVICFHLYCQGHRSEFDFLSRLFHVFLADRSGRRSWGEANLNMPMRKSDKETHRRSQPFAITSVSINTKQKTSIISSSASSISNPEYLRSLYTSVSPPPRSYHDRSIRRLFTAVWKK
ncbi:hypothetical protein P692DRAFT_20887134 [Suillus brevipes Sb2]|nr:hypothetical protein P692DRAFT_20887134 [Suillus brevipes Sb2]